MQVGSIVVSQRCTGGTGRKHIFGIITKQTPSGRFRVFMLESIRHQEDQHSGTDRFGSQTVVSPNADVRTGKSCLVNAQGEGKFEEQSIYFKVHDPATTYMDTSDFMW